MMSRDDLKIAFEMRLDGKTWDEIGYKLNYDESVARKELQKLVNRQYTNEKEEKNENKLQ